MRILCVKWNIQIFRYSFGGNSFYRCNENKNLDRATNNILKRRRKKAPYTIPNKKTRKIYSLEILHISVPEQIPFRRKEKFGKRSSFQEIKNRRKWIKFIEQRRKFARVEKIGTFIIQKKIILWLFFKLKTYQDTVVHFDVGYCKRWI